MSFDLTLRGARLASEKLGDPMMDVGVRDGLIATIAPRLDADAGTTVKCAGRRRSPGFFETHIISTKTARLIAVSKKPNASLIGRWSGCPISSTHAPSKT